MENAYGEANVPFANVLVGRFGLHFGFADTFPFPRSLPRLDREWIAKCLEYAFGVNKSCA